MSLRSSHGAGNGILTIARGTLPLAIFGPPKLWLPARHHRARRRGWRRPSAPLAFGLLIDTMGSRILIVSSALSLAALVTLFDAATGFLSDVGCDGIRFDLPFPSRPISRKTTRMENETAPAAGYQGFCAVGDHAAASLCGLLVAPFLVSSVSFFSAR